MDMSFLTAALLITLAIPALAYVLVPAPLSVTERTGAAAFVYGNR